VPLLTYFLLTVTQLPAPPQLQTLIQEADPGADYRIDRALNEACESVIQTACKHIRTGDPM